MQETPIWQTYLVEHYRPGVSPEDLRTADALVRASVEQMRQEGMAVRSVRSMFVPGDEAYLCLVDAESERLVCEAYERAGVPFERISGAIALDGPVTEGEKT